MQGLYTSLFRAENTDKFRPGQVQTRRDSVRLPVNVPYVIDNLWEFLRPESMPSRRHAVYASPTPQQALASGTKGPLVVAALRFAGTIKFAQLTVADAKDHPDIRAIAKAMQSWLDEFAVGGDDRRALAPLFLPGASKSEWIAATEASSPAAKLVSAMTHASTFWSSAAAAPVASGGETFFELMPGASYQLVAIAEAD